MQRQFRLATEISGRSDLSFGFTQLQYATMHDVIQIKISIFFFIIIIKLVNGSAAQALTTYIQGVSGKKKKSVFLKTKKWDC